MSTPSLPLEISIPVLQLAVSIFALIVPLVIAGLAFATARMNAKKLNHLEIQINGRLTKLLEVTARAERAEGVVQGGLSSEAIRSDVKIALAEAVATPSPSQTSATASALVSAAAEAAAEVLKTAKTAAVINSDTAVVAH